MVQNKKRLVSLILMLTLLVASVAALGISASAETATYEKVTTAPTDWSGTYLIVYEAGNKAFKGSLSTLDTTSNYVSVTIDNGTISGDYSANAFTIAPMSGGYSIQAASGKYIGHSSNANKLTSSDSALLNTISLNDDGTVNIICAGGAYLRYNATSGQDRFRYFKSSSYTNQKAICLYKLVENDTGSGETTCQHANTTTTTNDATCTVAGSTVVTCNDCGDTVSTTPIPAPGHTGGTATCENLAVCDTCGEEYGELAAHDYVEGACSVCGEEQATYYLVTSVDGLKAGDKIVIVATDYDYALSTTQNNNNRGRAGVTKGEDSVTFGSDVQILTLEAGNVDGTFAFNTGSGYLYAASSSSNHLKTETTLSENSSWSISIDGETGVATIVAQGTNTRNTLKYNSSSSIFSCYASTSTQLDVSIYKMVEADCEHVYGEGVVTAPTCTDGGYTTYTCTKCGLSDTDNKTPANGHSYTDGWCVVCSHPESTPAVDSALTIPQANAFGQTFENGAYSEGNYYVTGIIVTEPSGTYGNCYIKDVEGNQIYIYGLYDGEYGAEGTNVYADMTNKPVVGDVITVYGIIGKFNGNSQIKNAWVKAVNADVYFDFLGAGVRYKEADESASATNKVAVRFGYQLNDNVVGEVKAWGWNYILGSKDMATKDGEYMTDDGRTNLVITDCGFQNFEKDIQVAIWVTVDIGGTEYTYTDSYEVRTISTVLNTLSADNDAAAEYAQQVIDNYQASEYYTPVTTVDDEEN